MRRRCNDDDQVQGILDRECRNGGERRNDGKFGLAEGLEILAGGRLPLRFTAYDGSSAGQPEVPLRLDLKTPRGTNYLATGRGDLALARAHIAGDLDVHVVHPGDPYELLTALADSLVFTRPPARMMVDFIRSIGVRQLRPTSPPPEEAQPRRRRGAGGSGTARRVTPKRSTTTATSRTPSTSGCSDRR